MFICNLTFENGYTSPIQANTLEGIMQAVNDIIYVWKAPVKGINFMRIRAEQIKQGRPCEWLR